jgi:hypothetical protein
MHNALPLVLSERRVSSVTVFVVHLDVFSIFLQNIPWILSFPPPPHRRSRLHTFTLHIIPDSLYTRHTSKFPLMFTFIWVARAKHLADYLFDNSVVVSSLSFFHHKQKSCFWSHIIFRITCVWQQQKLCGFPDFFYVNELAGLEMGQAGSVLWTYGFLRLETKLGASRQTQRYSCRLSVRRYSVWSRRPIILTLVF